MITLVGLVGESSVKYCDIATALVLMNVKNFGLTVVAIWLYSKLSWHAPHAAREPLLSCMFAHDVAIFAVSKSVWVRHPENSLSRSVLPGAPPARALSSAVSQSVMLVMSVCE